MVHVTQQCNDWNDVCVCFETVVLCAGSDDKSLDCASQDLRGHEMNQFEGVFDCAFHPTQPWIFTAGADGSVCLFTN